MTTDATIRSSRASAAVSSPRLPSASPVAARGEDTLPPLDAFDGMHATYPFGATARMRSETGAEFREWERRHADLEAQLGRVENRRRMAMFRLLFGFSAFCFDQVESLSERLGNPRCDALEQIGAFLVLIAHAIVGVLSLLCPLQPGLSGLFSLGHYRDHVAELEYEAASLRRRLIDMETCTPT